MRALLFLMMMAGTASAECAEGRIDLRGDWGSARFGVEVADDALERSRGLMFVEKMGFSEGMLFVYPEVGNPVFWMKNTPIPLDMIFADETGVVTKVHENAIPGDLTGIPGGDGVQFVLEINGGLAGRLGIAPGSEMRHPSIGDDAAWPCE